MGNIWIVYNILIEVCCKTEYETIVSQITQTNFKQYEENIRDIKEQNEKFNLKLAQIEEL